MKAATADLENEIKSIIEGLLPSERVSLKRVVAEEHGYRNPDYVMMLFNDEHRSSEKIHQTSLVSLIKIADLGIDRLKGIKAKAERLRA